MTPGRTRTCIHLLVSRLPPDLCLFLIQPLAVRDTVSPHCQILHITHSPAVGVTLPFCLPGHMVGKTGLEPATPSSQNWCSSQLNYFPIITVFYNTLAQHLFFKLIFSSTQQNRTAIPRMKILWPDR